MFGFLLGSQLGRRTGADRAFQDSYHRPVRCGLCEKCDPPAGKAVRDALFCGIPKSGPVAIRGEKPASGKGSDMEKRDLLQGVYIFTSNP